MKNTTVLLPGGCNARCEFCFWDKESGKIKVGPGYLDKVFSTLGALPANFPTLSISGGEPTLSPVFSKFLARLGAYRRKGTLSRVVLTTNGSNLAPFAAAVGCVVDHINISRHGIGTRANDKIFGADTTPSDMALRDLILKVHADTHIDVTLNCVVPVNVTAQFCVDYLQYAKNLGADAVAFRKISGDLSPTLTEIFFRSKYGTLSQFNCPVCRSMVQNVEGYEVRWKASVDEPSIDTGNIYEVIIHPDGNLYKDWGMSCPISIPSAPIAGHPAVGVAHLEHDIIYKESGTAPAPASGASPPHPRQRQSKAEARTGAAVGVNHVRNSTDNRRLWRRSLVCSLFTKKVG